MKCRNLTIRNFSLKKGLWIQLFRESVKNSYGTSMGYNKNVSFRMVCFEVDNKSRYPINHLFERFSFWRRNLNVVFEKSFGLRKFFNILPHLIFPCSEVKFFESVVIDDWVFTSDFFCQKCTSLQRAGINGIVSIVLQLVRQFSMLVFKTKWQRDIGLSIAESFGCCGFNMPDECDFQIDGFRRSVKQRPLNKRRLPQVVEARPKHHRCILPFSLECKLGIVRELLQK